MIDKREKEGTEETRKLELWLKPQATGGLDRAFGGNMAKLLPPFCIIPKEFFHGNTKWNKMQARWFFEGLPEKTKFIPKPGIDVDVALGHLAAIQGSFEPAHEHKEAVVAWLASLWFEDIVIPQPDRDCVAAKLETAMQEAEAARK